MDYNTLSKDELREMLLKNNHSASDYFILNRAWENKFEESLKNAETDSVTFMKNFIKKFESKSLKQIGSKKFNLNALQEVTKFEFNKNSFFQNNQMQVSILLDMMSTNKLDCSDLVFLTEVDASGKIISGEFIWV